MWRGEFDWNEASSCAHRSIPRSHRRAASAGTFSDARVLTAMDVYAAAFSDRAESEKTRNMKREVSKLRSIVAEWRDISSKGKKGAGNR